MAYPDENTIVIEQAKEALAASRDQLRALRQSAAFTRQSLETAKVLLEESFASLRALGKDRKSAENPQ